MSNHNYWNLCGLIEESQLGVNSIVVSFIILNAAPIPWNVLSISTECHANTFVACTDGAANYVREYLETFHGSPTRFPSVIIGDMDSVTDDSRSYFGNLNIPEIVDSNQDYSDLYKAIQYTQQRVVVNSGQEHYIVLLGSVGALGGRIDHFFSTIWTLYRFTNDKVRVLSIGSESWMMVLHKGSHVLSLPAQMMNQPCGIVPIFGPVNHVTTSGFQWNIDGPMSFNGLVSTSNKIIGSVAIETTQSILFTVSNRV